VGERSIFLKGKEYLLILLWLLSFKSHFSRSLFVFIFCPLPIECFLLSMLFHFVQPLCFSTYHFSPSSLLFLFHIDCFKPIFQIGSQDPVSQHLTWECPGRDPIWQQPELRGRQRLHTCLSLMLLGCKQPWPWVRSTGSVLGENFSPCQF
jgi:hypothetical protein